MKEYLKQKFFETFFEEADKFLSCGGRFEVLGNHTDHNHGLCIAATCSLSIYAAIRRRNDNIVRFYSDGFGYSEIDLIKLDKKKNELGQSSALIRGIAYYLSKQYKVGGFNLYSKSEVPAGAGVSSSAAFELLIAQSFNVLFNDSKIPLMTLCKAGQFAERDYYGKMCGLLDQIGVAYGGLTFIDFKDIESPTVETIKLDLKDYSFLIVNSGGSHAGLSHLYKAIPDDMFKVANLFGKQYLRDVDYEQFKSKKQEIIDKCGQLSFERAQHFYGENQRVINAIAAIKAGNIKQLINLINQSRESSTNLLHNMYVDEIQGSPLEACRLILKASGNKAGVKINGGGFAGSVIALVPNDVLKNVISIASQQYGEENVYLISVRNDIPCELE